MIQSRFSIWIIGLTTVAVCVLGITASQSIKDVRIVSGSEAGPGEFKYAVSLQKLVLDNNTYKHFCAATIVDKTHVLTAAHCVWDKKPESFVIVAGVISLIDFDNEQRINVDAIHVHPNYTSFNKAGPNDIAILKLKTALVFNDKVGPVSLPNPGEQASGQCVHAGWGNMFVLSSLYYKGAQVLRKLNTEVISRMKCTILYYFIFKRPLETGLCTMAGPLKGTCQGDSGGPLICSRPNGSIYQAGIVSWGWLLCADAFHPDVSTDVSLFLDFIKNSLKS